MIERVKRRKQPPARPAPAAAARANLLYAYQAPFLEACLVRGLSEHGQRQRKQVLDAFISWCDERGIGRPQDITRPILQRYQRHLFHYRKSNGKPLALMTQITVLNQLRAFFRWLTVENHILYNPAADLEIPRRPHQLPKVLLSIEQVGEVLAQPNIGTAHGLRNRAILETLYSTGIRRSELARL